MKSIIFWDVTPCSLLRCKRRFGGTYRLHLQGRRNFQQEPACHLLTCWSLLKFSSTLKMEAICSTETSVDFQQTTRRHIPEHDTLQYIVKFDLYVMEILQLYTLIMYQLPITIKYEIQRIPLTSISIFVRHNLIWECIWIILRNVTKTSII
jgi:hypothetical protein